MQFNDSLSKAVYMQGFNVSIQTLMDIFVFFDVITNVYNTLHYDEFAHWKQLYVFFCSQRFEYSIGLISITEVALVQRAFSPFHSFL